MTGTGKTKCLQVDNPRASAPSANCSIERRPQAQARDSLQQDEEAQDCRPHDPRTRACMSVFGVLLTAHPLFAQDLSRYRDVEMGSPLLSVAGLSDLTPADAKVIHQRPALIQDLEWRPGRSFKAPTIKDDPVRQVMFSSCNDQLFRIVVNYVATELWV
ncbi:MAG TPA: hypothetical protein VHI98_02260 [Vicinamibacterales bacterium]|nr:hypothetical protein [Vicinamibacterales bacterium]